MKTNPFVVACTFMLGALVTLAAVGMFHTPAEAQDTNSQFDELTALTVRVSNEREVLVVFKESIESTWVEDDESDTRMAMAVYEIFTNGQQQAAVNLLATRYIDWDFSMVFQNTTKAKHSDLYEYHKTLRKFKEGIEGEREKRAEKEERRNR